jgi:hypothetical protein
VATPVQVANDVAHAHFATESSLAVDEELSSKRCRRSDFDVEPAWYLLSYKYLDLYEIPGSVNTQPFHVD